MELGKVEIREGNHTKRESFFRAMISTRHSNNGSGPDFTQVKALIQMNHQLNSGMEKQGSDPRAQSQHQLNPKPGNENNRGTQPFQSLEQKFVEDITRLAKDETKAEDAEIARHREESSEEYNSLNRKREHNL